MKTPPCGAFFVPKCHSRKRKPVPHYGSHVAIQNIKILIFNRLNSGTGIETKRKTEKAKQKKSNGICVRVMAGKRCDKSPA